MRLLLLLVASLSCGDPPRDDAPIAWSPAGPETPQHVVTIARPTSSGKLRTTASELSGDAVAIGCPTCHEAGRQASMASTAAGAGPRFHEQVQLVHGDLECKSCHSAKPHLLHTAAGELFAIEQSMTLCSQCHGLIRRAYDNGAHGGMRGYWDLQRGPRTRNDCITCHSPHEPAYPRVTPMPGPRDRFKGQTPSTGSIIEKRFHEHPEAKP